MASVMEISGYHALEAALQHGCHISSLTLAPPKGQTAERFVRDLSHGNPASLPKPKIVDRNRMTRSIGHSRHQGVVAQVELTLPTVEEQIEACESASGLLLAVDHLEDPQNVGAIIRSAVGLGLTGVVLPERRGAMIGDGMVRASAGTIFGQPPALLPGSLADLCLRVDRRGWEIIGLSMNGSPVESFCRNESPALLLIGGEHAGLKPLVQKRCTSLVSIPMANGVESLNASVAAGIAMAFLR